MLNGFQLFDMDQLNHIGRDVKVEHHLEDTFGDLFGPNGTIDQNQPIPSVAELLHYS